MGDPNNNVPPGSTRDPDTGDSREEFENNSQVNANNLSEQQMAWQANKKRDFDTYRQRDLTSIDRCQTIFEETVAQTRKELASINNVTLQALQNAVQTTHKISTDAADNVASTRAQVLKHADVACDAMWTDQLNPVTRGAGADLTGQAAVNAALASTASLDTAFTNLTAQVGLLVTLITTQAQALAANNAAMTALLAQMVQNAKQTPVTHA